MCLICIELIKHRMTLMEAQKAAKELLVGKIDKGDNDLTHAVELYESLEDGDLETLGKVLDEGENQILKDLKDNN